MMPVDCDNPHEPGGPVSESDSDYQVGYRKPPLHTRFKKGQSGNPRRRKACSPDMARLLIDALNQKVVVSENGRRRLVTKREAVIAQLVNSSATADLRATKMLIDILKDIEPDAGTAPVEPLRFTAADEEVIASFVARLRRQLTDEASPPGDNA